MKEGDPLTNRLFFAASIISVTTICLSLSFSVLLSLDIDAFLEAHAHEIAAFQNISREASYSLDVAASGRSKRQFYPTSYARERNRAPFSVYPDQSSEIQRPSGFVNYQCDCAITRCPPGPRGPPGRDGHAAIDGLPGEPGKPGTDGIFLVAVECEPCPQGKRGDSGPPGIRGARGKTGPPGTNGPDGVNEPGVPGGKGPRGQPGINGKDGKPGQPGQDAILLIGQPGKKGPPGPVGFVGPRGDPGPSGEPAPPGKEGPPGAQGAPGENGDEGPRGGRGRPGTPGENGGYCECPGRATTPPLGTENDDDAAAAEQLDYEEQVQERERAAAQRKGSISHKISSRPYAPTLPSLSLPTAPSASSVYPQSQLYPQARPVWSNPWQPSYGSAPQTAYIIPPGNYRNRYPMISYRDSREASKNGDERPSSSSGNQVEFDLR